MLELTALNATIGISQPVHIHAADPIAQFLRNCRRLGPRSWERNTSAAISAMTGIRRLRSTAPIVAPPL